MFAAYPDLHWEFVRRYYTFCTEPEPSVKWKRKASNNVLLVLIFDVVEIFWEIGNLFVVLLVDEFDRGGTNGFSYVRPDAG